VYENAHILREDVTLQHGYLKAMNKDMEDHPYLNHSKQKTEIVKALVLHPKTSILHVKRERCSSLVSQRVSGKYLGTQDLNIHKCTQLIMRVSKMQDLVQK
jgi:hypothetical protein